MNICQTKDCGKKATNIAYNGAKTIYVCMDCYSKKYKK